METHPRHCPKSDRQAVPRSRATASPLAAMTRRTALPRAAPRHPPISRNRLFGSFCKQRWRQPSYLRRTRLKSGSSFTTEARTSVTLSPLNSRSPVKQF